MIFRASHQLASSCMRCAACARFVSHNKTESVTEAGGTRPHTSVLAPTAPMLQDIAMLRIVMHPKYSVSTSTEDEGIPSCDSHHPGCSEASQAEKAFVPRRPRRCPRRSAQRAKRRAWHRALLFARVRERLCDTHGLEQLLERRPRANRLQRLHLLLASAAHRAHCQDGQGMPRRALVAW